MFATSVFGDRAARFPCYFPDSGRNADSFPVCQQENSLFRRIVSLFAKSRNSLGNPLIRKDARPSIRLQKQGLENFPVIGNWISTTSPGTNTGAIIRSGAMPSPSKAELRSHGLHDLSLSLDRI
jgi:hypothetical protein